MRTSAILFLHLLTATAAHPQSVTLAYDWNSIPSPHAVSADEATNPVVGLLDKRILEYAYDDKQKTDLVMYYTKHLIVKVNTADGIEQYNRIYVPVGGAMQVVNLKARSVSKTGRVVTLNENDIKTSEGDNEDTRYRYFALEGLEPGSEVEYLFQLKYDAALYGDERLQSDYPKRNVSFDLYVPHNFIFSTKSYNGLPEMQVDTASGESGHYRLQVAEMKPLKEERYAAYQANLQRVEYTVRFNTAISDKRILDWDAAAMMLYSQYFMVDKSESKEAARLIKQIRPDGDLKNRVIQTDNYLKTHIAIQQGDDPALSNIQSILKNKVANTRGITRLYIQVLTALDAVPELAITTNRYNTRFDPAFETWNFLEEVLLYVPAVNVYLAPDNFTARGGLPPQEYEDNEGLFIKVNEAGKNPDVHAEVRHIDPSDWSQNRHDIYALAELAPPFDQVKVHFRQEMTGHAAEFVQAYFQFMSDEDKQKLLEPVVQIIGQDGKVSGLRFINDLEENVAGRPFIIESDIQIASLIEKAGSRILFKIGNLLGEQVEMYSEENRQNDVENEFNRGYHRELAVMIPEGYRVKNLDALNMNVEAKDGDKTPYYFHSTYSVDGDTVKVNIQEVYQQIRYPADKFDDFRKVVNAAADWNKVVLIFEKVN